MAKSPNSLDIRLALYGFVSIVEIIQVANGLLHVRAKEVIEWWVSTVKFASGEIWIRCMSQRRQPHLCGAPSTQLWKVTSRLSSANKLLVDLRSSYRN